MNTFRLQILILVVSVALVIGDYSYAYWMSREHLLSYYQFTFLILALIAPEAHKITELIVGPEGITIKMENRLTRSEARSRAIREEWSPNVTDETEPLTKSQNERLAKKIVTVERKALKKYAELLGIRLDRLVGEPVSYGDDVEFDGALHRDNNASTLFEVKLVKDGASLEHISETIERYRESLSTFEINTGRTPRFILMLVVPKDLESEFYMYEPLYTVMDNVLNDFDWDLQWFSDEDLGVSFPKI